MSGSIRLTGANAQMGVGMSGGGLPRPYADLNFLTGSYRIGATTVSDIANVAGFAMTRATSAWYFDSAGLLQSVSSGVARQAAYNPVTLARIGLLVEAARTNAVLYSRDLTNAAWVASNITPTKDQVGIDGVSNSATRLTATAGNGTILQAITLGSSARQQSAFVKRITGSGVVNMTTDNGSTWTAVTVTSSWTRVTIPVQTLANPTVGFRIVTSGDEIAVDVVQNEAGTGASSPIVTTSAAVTRNADVPVITGLSISNPHSVVCEWTPGFDDLASLRHVASLNDAALAVNHSIYHRHSNDFVRVSITSQADNTIGTANAAARNAAAARFATNNVNGALNGAVGTADTAATLGTMDRIYLGMRSDSAHWVNGAIGRIRIYNTGLFDGQNRSLSV
jgi:hypothetical protein